MPLEIAGPIGPLEGLLDEPAPGRTVSADGLVHIVPDNGLRAAVVLAHPHTAYGGTMHTKVIYQAAKALSRIGCAVLRINFRGAGRSGGAFDNGPGEMDDFRAALDFVHHRYPAARLWAGGMSFGAWVAMTVGADHPRATALIGIAPAVTHYDFSPVVRAGKPTFIIHGERDELISLKEVRKFYAQLSEPKELIVIDAADHLFDGRVTEVGEAIEDLLQDFND
jgi:alpha/beta superfamily hydrolase